MRITSTCEGRTTRLIHPSTLDVSRLTCHKCGTSLSSHVLRVKRPDGERHWLWQGDTTGYQGVHSYMQRNYPKTGRCETCGKDARTHWSNVDHRYRRVRKDWVELCPSCHKKHDLALTQDGERGREAARGVEGA